jgi:hypothetical protein
MIRFAISHSSLFSVSGDGSRFADWGVADEPAVRRLLAVIFMRTART